MTTPTANIRVIEAGTRSNGSDYKLGTAILFSKDDLEAYCWRRLSKLDLDLLVLAGCVALADRRIKRRRGSGWARRMNLEVPVHVLDRWESLAPRVQDVLDWLTGDVWEVRFRARRNTDGLVQLYLPSDSKAPDVAVSYSGGLDSFAHASRLASSRTRAVLVTTWHSGLGRVVPRAFEHDYVRVPVRLQAGHEREQSYRTRPFLYFIAAALAARLRGAAQVVVPEPGQGALGPSLIPYGNEHPYRGTHPGFTSRLRGLLKALWHQNTPEFRHPNIWMTKAALVREGIDPGDDTWKRTRSCSRDIARTKGLGQHPDTRQCGVCGNCLLRRISLQANDLRDERYFWNDFASPILRASRAGVATTELNREVATYAVLDAENLARADNPDGAAQLDVAAVEIADGLQIDRDTARKNLQRLLANHRDEWLAFVSGLPQTGWLRTVAQR
jgi:hypothetical protein